MAVGNSYFSGLGILHLRHGGLVSQHSTGVRINVSLMILGRLVVIVVVLHLGNTVACLLQEDMLLPIIICILALFVCVHWCLSESAWTKTLKCPNEIFWWYY